MTWWDVVRFRTRALRRGRLEKEFDKELQFHLDELAKRHSDRGLSGEEARRAARREFGAPLTIKEDLRATRGLNVIDAFVQDLRYGVRLIGRAPGSSRGR
jgi:putative ABC transport system permease protein